jgi:hypothetical protein
LIEGRDDAGWTLDGYVIPRLRSGNYGVEEIDLSHPVMKSVPASAPRRGGADFVPEGKIGPIFTLSTPDFEVQDEGTIVLIRPTSKAASEWIEEHIPDDAPWFGNALAVEHRYAGDIVCGMMEDGLVAR